jgi:hypothetical protein
MVQFLVIFLDCWCATLSLFFINVIASTTYFDLIRSSSGRYFYVIATLYFCSTPTGYGQDKKSQLQHFPCKLNP